MINDGIKTTIERAFELANSGTCKSVDDIRRQLSQERYSNIDAHLAGPQLRKQLVKLIQAAA